MGEDVIPGDLITRPFQYELMGPVDGLVMGSNTPFQVLESNLDDLPEPKVADFLAPAVMGGFAGQDYAGVRKIQMKMAVDGTAAPDFQAEIGFLMDQLRKLLRPSSDDLHFTWLRPGFVVPRTCIVKPRKREFTLDSSPALGWAQGAIEVWAYDPRAYSISTRTQSLVIAAGATHVSGVIPSDGITSTPPVITFTGPTLNPRITNAADDNRTIILTVNLLAGQTMVVDTGAKTVFINGIDSYNVVDPSNQWWELQPGNNTISFNRTGTSSSSTAAFAYRDAYL